MYITCEGKAVQLAGIHSTLQFIYTSYGGMFIHIAVAESHNINR